MELANNTLTVCFAILRIIIIRVCVKIFVMARFILFFNTSLINLLSAVVTLPQCVFHFKKEGDVTYT
jgi:hypothetical protein